MKRCNSASVIRRALPTLTVDSRPALISRERAERESDVREEITLRVWSWGGVSVCIFCPYDEQGTS